VTFLLLYLLVFGASVTLLSLFGADLLTALTASIATLGNIGPGYAVVGPMGSYASLPVISKVVLILNMWIGRLEVITVLVLLQPAVWRAARWKD
jgi:trk system potassium uptake protein TrkH